MFQLSAKTSNMDVFMGVVLMASCIAMGNAESLGPPPGSPGIIDFRYPDYIVEPLPDCPHDGFFPHPRNCSWHYRCYDRIGLGFYWRAYFECPYGTTFAPGINNCINGFENSNCKGKNGTDVLPPPDNGICGLKMLNCLDYEVCINNQLPIILHLCETAYLECSITGIKHKCKDGMYYEHKNDRCLPNPDTLGCPECPDNLRPHEDWMKIHCIATDKCHPATGTQYFCHEYNKCYQNIVHKMNCLEGMIYSYDSERCVPLSDSKLTDCIVTNKFKCTKDKERVINADMIESDRCVKKERCNPNLEDAYLCKHYYVCKKKYDGNFRTDPEECDNGFQFNSGPKLCVSEDAQCLD